MYAHEDEQIDAREDERLGERLDERTDKRADEHDFDLTYEGCVNDRPF